MKRPILSLIVVALLAGTAGADQDVTFETVDEVTYDVAGFDSLQVRGIPQGQSEPVLVVGLVVAGEGLDRSAMCQRMALLAASRPGRYFLRVGTRDDGNGREFLTLCSLIRR
jgi:hypothetical protein